jgi:hypothetical protein
MSKCETCRYRINCIWNDDLNDNFCFVGETDG